MSNSLFKISPSLLALSLATAISCISRSMSCRTFSFSSSSLRILSFAIIFFFIISPMRISISAVSGFRITLPESCTIFFSLSWLYKLSNKSLFFPSVSKRICSLSNLFSRDVGNLDPRALSASETIFSDPADNPVPFNSSWRAAFLAPIA